MYVHVILCMPITESRLEKGGNNVLHPAPPHLVLIKLGGAQLNPEQGQCNCLLFMLFTHVVFICCLLFMLFTLHAVFIC